MQRETYNRLLGERLNEIQEISKKIDFNNLTFDFKTLGLSPINLLNLKDHFFVFKEIRDGEKLLKDEEE